MVVFLLIVLFTIPAAIGLEKATGFAHRGFYLHEGWLYKYPFAVRTWKRGDYAAMYRLLAHLGFDRVMNWPMLESIPAPLSEEDAAALREYRHTIDDAHAAGLKFWLAQTPNLTPPASIADRPWKQRNPYPVWRQVRLDDAADTAAYFAHRKAMMAIVNQADAYVTIDGDPGGYAGAKPDDWLSVFLADRAAIDACGASPQTQQVIPWVWCGWGTEKVWGGNPNNPPDQIAPFVRASLEVLAPRMPEPWLLLPGRSMRENWANGRVNIELAESFNLLPRSVLFCYEVIEYEPAIPGAVLQFDDIRRVLRRESQYANIADGVFGNAQQPVMVLPNLYFFARSARDLAYLDTPTDQILTDLADLLGGPRELLVPAWKCLELSLSELPADLPAQLRTAELKGEPASCIPGGSRGYLEILAAQVESRRGLLQAVAKPAESDLDAAKQLAAGAKALFDWWRVHGYVNDGDAATPFAWRFVRSSDVAQLQVWAAANVKDVKAVAAQAGKELARLGPLSEDEAVKRMEELLAR
jgi:hypothetical protein